MSTQKVLIDGAWVDSEAKQTFQATNPRTREPLPEKYPLSPWSEVQRGLQAAFEAADEVRGWPGTRFARFLERYAERIESRSDDLVDSAHAETALPQQPRLKDVELPRTTNQLRQAAQAARDGSWVAATIDTGTNIRSQFGPIGPVAVFGPNNFPFAFNSIAGGDFAAAVAAGNPVIAKGHSSHPKTTRLFGEAAAEAAREMEMPTGFVQLIYRTSHADGERLVGHPLLAASGYTGSRNAGLVLKRAADAAGKPIYLELSSINPVFILPGALEERLESLADEFNTSCLMGTGQFCTNPGLVVLRSGSRSQEFTNAVAQRFSNAPVGTLLGQGVLQNFQQSLDRLTKAGAQIVTGGQPGESEGFSFQNTLLQVDGDTFLKNAGDLQTEAFGNSSLFVTARDDEQMLKIAAQLEGNLTGSIYTSTDGGDDRLYDRLAAVLRQRVGRLLNDKMPTGVAVTSAMNHGGPYPATGHPGFTSVGLPTSMLRFARLECYDNVRTNRLPPALGNTNPTGSMWRLIDGAWTQDDVSV